MVHNPKAPSKASNPNNQKAPGSVPQLCKFGEECKKKGSTCMFKYHSKVYEECPYGQNCKNQGTNCPFMVHNLGSALPKPSAANNKKPPASIDQLCKLGEECKT